MRNQKPREVEGAAVGTQLCWDTNPGLLTSGPGLSCTLPGLRCAPTTQKHESGILQAESVKKFFSPLKSDNSLIK